MTVSGQYMVANSWLSAHTSTVTYSTAFGLGFGLIGGGVLIGGTLFGRSLGSVCGGLSVELLMSPLSGAVVGVEVFLAGAMSLTWLLSAESGF